MPPVPKPKRKRKAPSKGLKRSRLKCRGPRSKKSGGRLFYKDREPGLVAAVHSLPCDFCLADKRRQTDPTEAEHLKTRGSSGKDRNNVVATCAHHRVMRDTLGPQTMWAKYRAKGLDVWDRARDVTALYDAGKITPGFAVLWGAA